MRKVLAKSGIEYIILLRNWASVMSFCSHWRFSRKIWSFTSTLLIYIYNMDQTFKQGLGKSVGCMASKWIHKRTFIWNISKVWLWEMSCNQRLCRDVYWKTRMLSAQAATWSDYKHHNTFNFLVWNYTHWVYFVHLLLLWGSSKQQVYNQR